MSPGQNGSLSIPDLIVNSQSEILPEYNWEIKVIWPLGAIPTSPLKVVWLLYDEQVSLCKASDEGI
jgi:hypothetical protein